MSGSNTLSADFDLMRSVASTTDARNEEIRVMLQSFIGRMSSVPRSVWGGLAAARFKDVLERWDAESARLYRVLHTIAETIRHNEGALREASQSHAHSIAVAGGDL
ncbi:WXG100 family type VII secretion target [Mycobacterium spongiae]|uniref:Type VII secretion protein EsxU n=1 Tax=Mycobacterium spongiae TaxID=886343 RepID=A0A975PW69_9MYCO|nr:WXG100 family type VII secretion target [Mycobacterium spongiae]QUR66479.1 type VII secretion protein EsxU [Mycobacterium spongiae]